MEQIEELEQSASEIEKETRKKCMKLSRDMQNFSMRFILASLEFR